MNLGATQYDVDKAVRQAMPYSAIVDIDGIHNPKTGGFHVVQDAIDAGHQSIFVRKGVYPSFDFDKGAVHVTGECRRDTVIDGTTVDHAVDVTKIYCSLHNLNIRTTPGGGSAYNAIHMTSGGYLNVLHCVITSDNIGMLVGTAGLTYIHECFIGSCDSHGLQMNGNGYCHVFGCYFGSNAGDGINFSSGTGDNNIAIGNHLSGNVGYGVLVGASDENCVVVGNRAGSNTAGNITDNSGTSVVSGNDTT